MMETIVSWLAGIVGEALEGIMTIFFNSLTLTMDKFIEVFPVLPATYKIFQAIGMGLVLGIGMFQLMKFFGGQLTEIKDTPIRILLRSAAATGLIWFGGYAITLVVDLARTPYDVLINGVDAAQSNLGFSFGSIDAATMMPDVAAVGLGAGAILTLSLIMMLLIGWNVIKLMIEVCERFIMVGVLAYSAPLVFPTVASSATGQIFKKWLGMFFGQCLLMTITVWSMKVILSGFTFDPASGTSYFVRFVLTLAMCKIAQRIDTYMQQLGIGVATTGGNLIDDAIGLAATMGRFGGGKNRGGNGDSVLGSQNGNPRSLSNFSGLFGGASNAIQKGLQSFKAGDDMNTVAKTMAKGAKDGALNGMFIGGRAANKLGSIMGARKEAMEQKTAESAKVGSEAFAKRSAKYQERNGTANGYSNDIQSKATAMGMTAQQYSKAQFESNGVGGITQDASGKSTLDNTAKQAGLQWKNDLTNGKPNMIKGTDNAVGEHMAKNYSEAPMTQDYQSAMVQTAKEGSAIASEEALMNPHYELSGNDQMGAALMENSMGDGFTAAYSTPDKNGDYHDMAEFQSALENTACGEVGVNGEGIYNMAATTDPESGARTVSCDYKAASGQQYKVETMDEVGYAKATPAERADLKSVKAKSGETYYTKVTQVERVDAQPQSVNVTPPQAVHSTQTTSYQGPSTSAGPSPVSSSKNSHTGNATTNQTETRSSTLPKKNGSFGPFGKRGDK